MTSRGKGGAADAFRRRTVTSCVMSRLTRSFASAEMDGQGSQVKSGRVDCAAGGSRESGVRGSHERSVVARIAPPDAARSSSRTRMRFTVSMSFAPKNGGFPLSMMYRRTPIDLRGDDTSPRHDAITVPSPLLATSPPASGSRCARALITPLPCCRSRAQLRRPRTTRRPRGHTCA